MYPNADFNLPGAEQRLPSEYNGIAELGRELLPFDYKLYAHQWDSLRDSLVNKKDLVVTTGTGSGKTECFLLPLLGQLARESAGWTPPNVPSYTRDWWNHVGAARTSQWEHVTRPSAVRGLILYPLNALVEDQMRRLRRTLDSIEVHHWLDMRATQKPHYIWAIHRRHTCGRSRELTLKSESCVEFLENRDDQRQALPE